MKYKINTIREVYDVVIRESAKGMYHQGKGVKKEKE